MLGEIKDAISCGRRPSFINDQAEAIPASQTEVNTYNYRLDLYAGKGINIAYSSLFVQELDPANMKVELT